MSRDDLLSEPTSPPDNLRVVLRDSAYNKRARAMLKRHRFNVGMTQAKFAIELTEELQARIAMTTLSGYENGQSGVPASVLLAAAAIAHHTIGANPVRSIEDRIEQIEEALLLRQGGINE